MSEEPKNEPPHQQSPPNKEPQAKKSFHETHPWWSSSIGGLSAGIVAGLIYSGILLGFQYAHEEHLRETDAKSRMADETAEHQAALDALVMEIHSNADVARSHIGLIDRNREKNYEDLAIFAMPHPSTRVFDSMGASGPVNFLHAGDYIAVAALYANLKFMDDVVRSDEEQRGMQSTTRACDNGLIRQIEDTLRNKDEDVLRASSYVVTMLGSPDYGLPREIIQSQGYYDYWMHQPDAGSLVTTHTSSIVVRTGVRLVDGGWLLPSGFVQP